MAAINNSPAKTDYNQYTPLKYHASSVYTNYSSAFSTYVGNSKYRDSEENRIGWRSNQFLNDFPSAQLTTIRAEDFQNNQSCVTLNPATNTEEMQELFKWQEMILFQARDLKQLRNVANRKQQTVYKLRQEIMFREKIVSRQKQKYEKLQCRVQRARLRAKNSQRRSSTQINRKIHIMDRQIRKMQRTLSTNKLKGINSKQEHKRMGEDKKKKKIIYVPILYDNPFIPHRGSDHTQRSDTVQYQHRPPHLPYPQANGGYPMQHYPLNYSQTQRKEYLQSQVLMGQTRSRRNSDSQSAPNVLDLLSQKLRTEPFIPMDSGNQKATMNRKMEAADQEIVSSKGNFNIHIRAPQEKQQNEGTDYFNNQKFKEIEAQQIALFKRESKDTSLNHEPESEGEEEVRKTLKLIQDSITKPGPNADECLSPLLRDQEIMRSSAKKFDPNNLGLKTPEAQLSNDLDISLPEKSRSKEQHIHNSSDIDISYESDDKKNSRSQESTEKKSRKEPSFKNNIDQSNVNIILESLQSPKNASFKEENKTSPRVLSNLEQQIASIEEVEEEDILSRQATPVELPSSYGSLERLEYSNQGAKAQMKAKAESIEESDPNSAKTPLLSNPPSLRDLVEEEAQAHDQDDMDFLSNINLSPQSRKVVQQVSRLSQQSKYKTPAGTPDQDDDIFGICLVTESKISRDRKSELKSSQLFQNLHTVQEDIMTQSEPEHAKRFSFQEVVQKDEDEENIRNSTTSSFVRKGSAIQKVKQRSPVNSIKMSNYGSPMGRSSLQVSPIKEEQEQMQNLQVESKKHKKNTSSIK